MSEADWILLGTPMNYGKLALIISVIALAIVLLGNPFDRLFDASNSVDDSSVASTNSSGSHDRTVTTSSNQLSAEQIQSALFWSVQAASSGEATSRSSNAWISTVPDSEKTRLAQYLVYPDVMTDPYAGTTRDVRAELSRHAAQTVIDYAGIETSEPAKQAFIDTSVEAVVASWNLEQRDGSQVPNIAELYGFLSLYLTALQDPEEFCSSVVLARGAANSNSCYPDLRPDLADDASPSSPSNPFPSGGKSWEQHTTDAEIRQKQRELEQAENYRKQQEYLKCLDEKIQYEKDKAEGKLTGMFAPPQCH